MKKILIPMLSLMVLPLAAPSSAKFYSEETKRSKIQEEPKAIFEEFDLHPGSAYHPDYVARDTYRSWQRHHFGGGTTKQEAQDQPDTKDDWPAQRQLTKQEQKKARNSSYGKHGSSGGSKGSSKQKGGSSNGSKASSSYNHGSKGSKGTKWLSKEKRKRQLDTFKRIMHDKHNKGSTGSRGWPGDSKDSRGSKHGNPKKNMPERWDFSNFKHYDKDFWSHKGFDKAMLCWLAPHLHEDKEFVNRYWNKWGYKWKWMHKYYKHKHHKPKHDKPPEIPVPASAVLFGSALLGLASIGKRRHK